MTNSLKISLVAFISGVVFLLLLLSLLSTRVLYAAAPPGLQATLATTSNPTVTSTANLIIASSTCNARIITTYGSAVMITFADNFGTIGGPTATFGHLQAASTTISYNADMYGCGAVRIYSFTTQAITVSDSR